MREWLKQRPWIWIVVFFVVMFIVEAVFILIAVSDPPIPV